MDQDQPILIGHDLLHNQPRYFHPDDRQYHLTVVGKTGVGKSTLIKRMAIADIQAGRGVVFIDPHGQEAEALLDYIPPWRTDHVCYFNPADTAYPVGFNPFSAAIPEQHDLVVDNFVAACKAIWKDSWGPRLEDLLSNCAATLLETPTPTITAIPRLLYDPAFRGKALAYVRDPELRRYWQTEFEGYGARLKAEASLPVLNKIRAFTRSPTIRAIVDQHRSKLDLRFLMDRERILIVNLAQGRIGTTNSKLLGALIITKLYLTALSRIDLAETERRACHLYVDEFQNFTTEAFDETLSQARKFRLCLTLANQHLEQIPAELRASVFGNVGSIVSFKVRAADAEVLAGEFDDHITPAMLTGLDRFQVIAALAWGSGTTQAERLATLPVDALYYGRGGNIVQPAEQFPAYNCVPDPSRAVL
jgi:hypothetical protein